MRRLLPLAAATLAIAGGVVMAPGQESGACAQGGSAVVPRADCESETTLQSCGAVTEAFRSVRVRPAGRGLRLSFTRRVARPVTIDVFQVSTSRRVLGQRLVARFRNRSTGVRWRGGRQPGRVRVRDGYLFARFSIPGERGRFDRRRVALVRRGGRFSLRPEFYRRTSCATLTSFKLARPAFGGRSNRALAIAFRLARRGSVGVEVRRGGRVVRRFRTAQRRQRITHRLRLSARGLRRGTYEIRLVYRNGQSTLTASLYSQRL